MFRLIRIGLDKLAAQLIEPLKPPSVFLLGAYTLVWGLWVVNPWWSVFNQSMLFSVMKKFMPEWTWGVIALILGSLLLFGLAQRSYYKLVIASGLTGWFWIIVSGYYFAGDWKSTGGLTAIVFMVHAMFIFLNLRVNKNRLGLDKRYYKGDKFTKIH